MQTPDLNKERLETLKTLFPDLFTVEGKLNPDELKKIIDPELVKETERFEFKWFGKSEAKRNAFTPSKATLVYDEERSVNPEYADGNMIIEGENLESLKCLLSAYRERVKCIYIDPPYNTGKDFVYSDRWNESKESYWEHIGVTADGVKLDSNNESSGRYHSNWLNMIYPRLLLARQLLRDDGVIFISIDDSEVHHLRKLCDEIFGEENFIEIFIWRSRQGKGGTASETATIHEYIMCYSRCFEMIAIKQQERISQGGKERLRQWGQGDKREDRPSMFYSIYTPSREEVLPIKSDGTEGRWRIGKVAMEKLLFERQIVFEKRKDGYFEAYKIIPEGYKTFSAVDSILPSDIGTTATGSIKLKETFGTNVFDYSKPSSLIHYLLELANGDLESIVIDFFAGSGTTAQAVMELNKEDGGNRKFILIQISEITDVKSEAYKAGYKKISDITIERNKRVIQKIEKEVSEKQPDLLNQNKTPFRTGFKVYKLAKSNFPRIDFAPDPAKTEEENLALLDKYIEDKEAMFLAMIDEKNIFDEVLLKNGFMLNYSKMQEVPFSKNNVFRVKDSFKECLICMDMTIEKQTLKDLESYKDSIFICLERSLDTTIKWNLKHLLGDKLIAF